MAERNKVCAWDELNVEQGFQVLDELRWWSRAAAFNYYHVMGEVPDRADTEWEQVLLYSRYVADCVVYQESLTNLSPDDPRIRAFASNWNSVITQLEDEIARRSKFSAGPG